MAAVRTGRRNIAVAKQLPNMIGHAHLVYFYCDLLEHVTVGSGGGYGHVG